MIWLYSGTPGSGKSLDVAQLLYHRLRHGQPVICNFPVNVSKISKKKANSLPFTYISNGELTPQFLIDYSINFFRGKKVKEESILLIIDECQLMFNARNWAQSGREEWLSFFTQHRKFGYKVILVAQFDRMIDRQIRSLIEYEVIHRKCSNFGLMGQIISLFFGGSLFVGVKMWYPLKERVDKWFFPAWRKYYQIYDTYSTFGAE